MIFNEKELELTNCCLRFHKAIVGKKLLNFNFTILFGLCGFEEYLKSEVIGIVYIRIPSEFRMNAIIIYINSNFFLNDSINSIFRPSL